MSKGSGFIIDPWQNVLSCGLALRDLELRTRVGLYRMFERNI